MLEAKKALDSKLIDYEIKDTYLHITTDTGFLKLQPYNDVIIRITYSYSDEFTTDNSPGVIAEPTTTKWHLEDHRDSLELLTDSLSLTISKDTCSITYKDSDGNVLLKEPKYDGKALDTFTSYKTILDDDAVIEKHETADGVKETIVSAKKEFDRELYHGRLEFEWQDDEALYGLGQNEEGILNLRGHRLYIHQANKKIAVPFLLSSNNYGILFDTYSPLIFNDNEYGSYMYTEAIESLDYYFIAGSNFDSVIAGYRTLTGQATMLPRWTFGYMQSFERYESADELIETIKEHRRREIPIDSIILDWHSWEGNQWGQKTYDKSRFEDPRKMYETLHSMNAHYMISIWPNMHESGANHQELKAKGFMFQKSETYNAFDPEARAAYWLQAKEGIYDYGLDGWWTDSSEPFVPAWSSKKRGEPDKNMYTFHETAKTYIDETLTNAFPLFHGQTLYEGQRSATVDKRVLNLTRSGYTGQQRYGNILWSGDIAAKWSTLKTQIAAGLNLCASGLPYWTLDIGAFFVKRSTQWFWNGDYDDGNQDPAYRELYTRWFQYATFLPVLRAHGTDTRREVWQFGEPGTPYYDAIVKFIKLRYKLLPYIYSLAGMVTQKHSTMLRLLAFDYNSDSNVYNIDDQFMFGDALMVCPIIESSGDYTGKSNATRNVYLPKGNDWYDYWNGRKYSGGGMITVTSPIDELPLFVKAGSLIPMTSEELQHTGSFEDSAYDVHVYSGCDGAFTLYQDSNDSYDYENGQFRMIDLEWNDNDQQLSVSNVEGAFQGQSDSLIFKVYVNGSFHDELRYNG